MITLSISPQALAKRPYRPYRPKPIRAIKYMVEVRQGADTYIEFPWWGPLEWAKVVDELKEEGYAPVSIAWDARYDHIVRDPQ